LSYHRTREPSSKSGSSTMTVCTNHVADGDLVQDGLPVAVAQACGDVEVLGSEMVELEDEWVGLATVSTRPSAEELDQVGGALGDGRLFAARRVRDIAAAVRQVVVLFVGRPAGATVVVALTAGLSAPGEVRERLCLTAAAAGSQRLGAK